MDFFLHTLGPYLLLIVAGFLAGIANTIAGGGSFLTLPALMYLCGLEPKIANGTNRIAILFSSAAAAATFHHHGKLDKKLARQLAIPTLLGVPFGSLLAVYLPAESFKPIFGCIFLAMAGLLLYDPKRLLLENVRPDNSSRWIYPVFLAIGVYVGFIQAGMGILLLIAMSYLNTGDLVASNGVKNLIGFFVTLVATIIFAFSGLIEWLPGIVMAAGNVLGGFAGAKLAIKKGNRLIFMFLVVVMIATGVQLIWSSFQTAA